MEATVTLFADLAEIAVSWPRHLFDRRFPGAIAYRWTISWGAYGRLLRGEQDEKLLIQIAALQPAIRWKSAPSLPAQAALRSTSTSAGGCG
jgi:hypothetical protein